MEIKKLLSCFDGGSLKILWVTYQIIMSVTWNLDVAVIGSHLILITVYYDVVNCFLF
jgi:hypothetical protein